MDLGLTGRRALVTGASMGIGLTTAETLAAEGCDVWLVARSADLLEEAAARIREEHGVAAHVAPADLSRSEEVDRLWAEVPLPDILVNNAGAIPSGTIAAVDEETWREAWDLKVFGFVNLCRHAMADMGERGSGVIVNVIGGAGVKPTPGYIAGVGGNAALMAITQALGSTSTRKGVRVVGINPGLIHTPRLEGLMRDAAERRWGDPDRWTELLDPRFPPGTPQHIADAVAFLASDRSANTTGAILNVDGGGTAR
ncbi:short-chain dehydrogenase/reductase [Actinomarinicola tropica]|uniref:SDR family oxidoreductase n=1 Tax=Actinomarinicola tropica TaxID=2789776 RepID=A0A5Q2RRI4_9ACTN|nr:short-chain dehydrogenase/reductase [Actinomarinicola tropica]QGG96757.1 SDR family oxidoreductase [Actinomarinicola tropica]